MQMDESNPSEIYIALKKLASGYSQASTVKSSTIIDGDNRKSIQQHDMDITPNFHAIQKLLDYQIGGPQDYC